MSRTVIPGGAAAFALAAALCLPARAATSGVTSEMDRAVREGVDAIYNMDFDGAQAIYERMRALNPEHPFAEFGLSAVAWARYVYGSEMGDDSLLKPFEDQVERTVKVGRAWCKAHPDDAEGLVALGAAQGIEGRLLATRRQYIRAYMSARASMKSVRQAVKIDPEFKDPYLGLGMYDYYTDLYPRMIRPLAKLVLRGDRERGIRQIRLVADHGRWMSVTGKMILVEISLHDPYGARDPALAVKLMEEVRAKYPKSAMLHSAHLIALYQAGRLDDFHKGSEEFVRKTSTGEYRKMDVAKGYVLLGTSFVALRRPEQAVEAFLQAAQHYPGNRWAVWALIRAGNVYDLMGKREEALSAYKRAAEAPDRWGYKEHALSGLGRPFKIEGEFTVDPP